jgi:hypothetical protein
MFRAFGAAICLAFVWTCAAPAASASDGAAQAQFVAYTYQLVRADASATQSWAWPSYGIDQQVEGMARVDVERTGPVRGSKSIGYTTKTGGLTIFRWKPVFRENGSYQNCEVGPGQPCMAETCSSNKRHIDLAELDFHKSIRSADVKVVFNLALPEENADCPNIPGAVPPRYMTRSFPFSLFKGIGYGSRVTLSLSGDYTYVASGPSGGHSTFEWDYEVVLKRVR